MEPAAIAQYLGLALLYAGGMTALLCGALRLVGRPATSALAGLVLSVLFVVFLGLHPFPDPAHLDCALDGKQPRLRPFDYVSDFVRLRREDAPPVVWIRHTAVLATVMNVVFFAVPGFLAARLLRSAWTALLLGSGISLFIELAQLTALFGVYPCPYRTFDVDDLLLNVSGVMAGFLAARLWRRLS